MNKQNYQKSNLEVINKFLDWRKNQSNSVSQLKLSWSNWGFGQESLKTTAARLKKNNIKYIELHGNTYGKDLGYNANKVKKILQNHGIKVSGVCGMVSPESEFASNKPHIRQRCIDYFRRAIDLCAELGGEYVLFAPGAVGRPEKYDNYEFDRAAETIRTIGDYFVNNGVKGAIEPVRSEEVSFCHTLSEAERLIQVIDHPGVKHIAGDIYHIIHGEENPASSLLEYGDRLINLHLADTNRRALGKGCLNLDVVLMSVYLIKAQGKELFCTPEPLGPGGDPYKARYGKPDQEKLDQLVKQTASYFFEREKEILEASEEGLLNDF